VAGCITVLSIYNSESTCFVHTGRKHHQFSGSMEQRLDAIAFQELVDREAA